MTVREFLEVIPFSLVDYAKIYETQWGEYFDSAIYINMPKEK